MQRKTSRELQVRIKQPYWHRNCHWQVHSGSILSKYSFDIKWTTGGAHSVKTPLLQPRCHRVGCYFDQDVSTPRTERWKIRVGNGAAAVAGPAAIAGAVLSPVLLEMHHRQRNAAAIVDVVLSSILLELRHVASFPRRLDHKQ